MDRDVYIVESLLVWQIFLKVLHARKQESFITSEVLGSLFGLVADMDQDLITWLLILAIVTAVSVRSLLRGVAWATKLRLTTRIDLIRGGILVLLGLDNRCVMLMRLLGRRSAVGQWSYRLSKGIVSASLRRGYRLNDRVEREFFWGNLGNLFDLSRLLLVRVRVKTDLIHAIMPLSNDSLYKSMLVGVWWESSSLRILPSLQVTVRFAKVLVCWIIKSQIFARQLLICHS